MRPIPILVAALLLGAAPAPKPLVEVSLPPTLAGDATGRLLLFATPASDRNSELAAVDLDTPDGSAVALAGRDVKSFREAGSSDFDPTADMHFPDLSALSPGSYRIQAVLDRNGDYAYAGRGPGDLVSRVITIKVPLVSTVPVPLDRAEPVAPDQFDTMGLPPVAAGQIAASRPHLHDERISSGVLSRFRHSPQAVRAWVLTPPGYEEGGKATYPTVYTAGGFGTDHRQDGQQLSKIWHLMETHAIPPMIWVALDYATPTGTTEFADSVNNGPWGDAFVREVLPALERRYRMDARPSGRFLTGHSSGGWFALWTMVNHPKLFGGSWSTSPDPVDFRNFLGVDLYAPHANMYRDPTGRQRPLERDGTVVRQTIGEEAHREDVLANDGDGGQLRSFEWTFSPRGSGGRPARLFDRRTGAIDPDVAAYWRRHYDIAELLTKKWSRVRRDLVGKIHIRVGTEDSFYLDGSVHRLDAALRALGAQADIGFVPGASHAMSQVYARNGDRAAYWKEMTAAMYATARPQPDRN